MGVVKGLLGGGNKTRKGEARLGRSEVEVSLRHTPATPLCVRWYTGACSLRHYVFGNLLDYFACVGMSWIREFINLSCFTCCLSYSNSLR